MNITVYLGSSKGNDGSFKMMARELGTCILNADSRQIYSELKIGTASPTEEQMRQVKHYFVGTRSVTEYYNASMYEQDVQDVLNDV